MVVTIRKKNSRQRASTTHGWGSMKKHRGAGNRGGRGKAGSGKRGDSNKPTYWDDKKYFGRYGFRKKGQIVTINSVNLFYLEQNLNKLTLLKKIKKENDVYVIDLGSLGYNKLLGTGQVNSKLQITTVYASKIAIDKIKKAGGSVKLSKEVQ